MTSKNRFSKFVSGKLKEIGNTILPPNVDELSLRETSSDNSIIKTDNPSELAEGKKIRFDDFRPTQNSARKSVVKQTKTEAKPTVTAQLKIEQFHEITTEKSEENSGSFSGLTFTDFIVDEKELLEKNSDPKEEFSYLLLQILEVLKITTRAFSVALFWVNKDKKQLILESSMSDAKSFMTQRRFPFGNDLVSKVAINANAELLSPIKPQAVKDLLCYYTRNESVQTFVGVPVFLPNALSAADGIRSPVAVLIIDSQKEESYGEKTLRVLAYYSKMIAVLLKSYTEKYDLFTDAKVVKSLAEFKQLSRQDSTAQNIADKLVAAASEIVDADDVTVVLFDSTTEKWHVVSQLRKTLPLSNGQAIDFTKSLVGESIRTRDEIFVENISKEENIIRYFPGENLTKEGSFLCLPILVQKKCIGAIVFEKEISSGFSSGDTALLNPLITYAGMLLEVSSAKQFISEFVAIDSATKVMTEQYFRNELESELERTDNFGGTPALAVIGIDDEKILLERFGESGVQSIRRIIAEQIQSGVRTFDFVGKIEQFFIALLINTNASEMQLWGEKLRKTIASNVLNDNGKPFSVTVSIGICAPQKTSDAQIMITNARNAMTKAQENGGNALKIF